MDTYRILTSSVVYAYYEVEAASEDDAREMVEDGNLEPDNEWSEDTGIDEVEMINTDTCQSCGAEEVTVDDDLVCMDCAEDDGEEG